MKQVSTYRTQNDSMISTSTQNSDYIHTPKLNQFLEKKNNYLQSGVLSSIHFSKYGKISDPQNNLEKENNTHNNNIENDNDILETTILNKNYCNNQSEKIPLKENKNTENIKNSNLQNKKISTNQSALRFKTAQNLQKNKENQPQTSTKRFKFKQSHTQNSFFNKTQPDLYLQSSQQNECQQQESESEQDVHISQQNNDQKTVKKNIQLPHNFLQELANDTVNQINFSNYTNLLDNSTNQKSNIILYSTTEVIEQNHTHNHYNAQQKWKIQQNNQNNSQQSSQFEIKQCESNIQIYPSIDKKIEIKQCESNMQMEPSIDRKIEIKQCESNMEPDPQIINSNQSSLQQQQYLQEQQLQQYQFQQQQKQQLPLQNEELNQIKNDLQQLGDQNTSLREEFIQFSQNMVCHLENKFNNFQREQAKNGDIIKNEIKAILKESLELKKNENSLNQKQIQNLENTVQNLSNIIYMNCKDTNKLPNFKQETLNTLQQYLEKDKWESLEFIQNNQIKTQDTKNVFTQNIHELKSNFQKKLFQIPFSNNQICPYEQKKLLENQVNSFFVDLQNIIENNNQVGNNNDSQQKSLFQKYVLQQQQKGSCKFNQILQNSLENFQSYLNNNNQEYQEDDKENINNSNQISIQQLKMSFKTYRRKHYEKQNQIQNDSFTHYNQNIIDQNNQKTYFKKYQQDYKLTQDDYHFKQQQQPLYDQQNYDNCDIDSYGKIDKDMDLKPQNNIQNIQQPFNKIEQQQQQSNENFHSQRLNTSYYKSKLETQELENMKLEKQVNIMKDKLKFEQKQTTIYKKISEQLKNKQKSGQKGNFQTNTEFVEQEDLDMMYLLQNAKNLEKNIGI